MPTTNSPPPARVARIITRLNIGGPAIQAARLVSLLEQHGYRTRLIHGRLGADEGDMRYLLEDGADTVYLPSLGRSIAPLDDARTLLALVRELRSFQPQIVHTHTAKAGFLGRLAAAVYNLTRGAAPRARVVHTYHGHVLEGYFNPVASRTFIALERLLARITDVIVTVAPSIQQTLFTTYRIGRERQYRVIPLGFELESFAAIDDHTRAEARVALGLAADALVVTTVGRLTAIKQPQLFLDTVARLASRVPKLVALVAGDGELRQELRSRAASLGLADRVRWLGWRRDLTTVYAATDVFLLTSRNEGTPVALIEAMASAVSGVSTDVGGVRDVIESPAVGRLVAPVDSEALAAAAEKLLTDASLRREIGSRARAHVVTKYGIERLVNDILKIYGELLGG